MKDMDPWAILEAAHDQEDMNLDWFDWNRLAQGVNGLIGYYQARAVLAGTDAADKELDDMVKDAGVSISGDKLNFIDVIKNGKAAIRLYHKENEQSETEQLALLMKLLRLYYEQESIRVDIGEEYEDENLKYILFFTAISDAPAYMVKAVAEEYGVDFWELWKQLGGAAKRKVFFFSEKTFQKVEPVSTMDFLGITPDNMILFWGEDERIHFSEELKEWFADLRSWYDEILEEDAEIEDPLCWILDLMEYADENYYRIYTFSNFFKETLEHLSDKRFLAFWILYDEMLYDPEMEEEGSVIFVPEGPEYEDIGLQYIGTPPRRRLMMNWEVTDIEERNNEARVTLRRYMALLGNPGLRKMVFGC